MQNTLELIKNFIPSCEQEETDKQHILDVCCKHSNLLSRENNFSHFTSSAFVLNREHTKVLCCFHNIYQSWSLLGGHADGNDNLLNVAKQEIAEESSLQNVITLSEKPISLDILVAEGHVKNSKWISAHLHFNTCFLFEADENAPIKNKPDENSAVAWLNFEELITKAREPQMKIVYKKIIKKIKNFRK